MATLDWHTTSADGVTFVELLVESETTETVRVENCLDGPVWPPRRQGVPATGWSDDGFEGTVGPTNRLVVGYASPADPADPPARLVHTESEADDSSYPTPASVVRALGDPTPPREAVPRPDESDLAAESAGNRQAGEFADRRIADVPASQTEGQNAQADPVEEQTTTRSPDTEFPPAVTSHLGAVQERVEMGEQLSRPTTPSQANAALDAVGGPEDGARLQQQLAADRDVLRRLADQCETLAARIESVDVPVELLARVA